MNNIPLSLYIHTPWCIQKCPYCDFNSHALRNELPENAYINSLIAELNEKQHLIQDRPIQTIFIGGGTPSLLSPDAYQRLFNTIRETCSFSDNIEITLEANPGTVEQKRFEGFRQAGINRLSLGIQSFQDTQLKRLGRIHDSQEAKRAIDAARNSGFERINLDLMYGLPNQTVSDALYDLEQALAFDTTHLSWYHLTLEPNTLFHKYPPPLPEDDIIWDIQEAGHALLAKNAYLHYEVSAHTLGDQHCQHNLNYWQFGDYLGIGAGAHSKITYLETGERMRLWNYKHPNKYLNADLPATEGQAPISHKDLPLEFMMNALRLQQATPYTLYTERTGLPKETIYHVLQTAEKQKFVTLSDDHFTVNQHGMHYLNELLQLFMAD